MTINALLEVLDTCRELALGDPEVAHALADKALLKFISELTGSDAVTEAFNRIEPMCYA